MAELKPKRKGNYRHTGNPKHGLYRENARLFNVWQSMKGRCENPNIPKYKDYGGRGIKVCEEWHKASNFVLWALSHGYKQGLQLDRIDNNGDYCPENCHFVTPQENSRNRRNTKYLTINGETKRVVEWCALLGLNQYTVYDWIRKRGTTYAEQRISQIA
jgi:hypothetical protein